MPHILIPAPLRQYAGGQSSVEAPGATVAEVLAALTSLHPDLRKHLFSDQGGLRSFVNIYVGDEDIRYLEKEQTAVGASETLTIVPSIAGGAR
ncbi:MAG: MoaD/ThiS family protein [Candidatus Solibacter usitatus]|nr:MoaD/ThiS family protein [Candidatus Solibacter usitatus]